MHSDLLATVVNVLYLICI